MIKPPYRVPLMSEIAALPKNGFRAISTFSGCGGSSLGYKLAGFDVLWASEFIPAAQETYRLNHPTTKLDTRDIRQVTAQDIFDATHTQEGELDLFDGSPPCASFSTAGIGEKGWGKVRKYSDSKQRTDDLFMEFARLVKAVQPKVFVAENVKGLTNEAASEKLGDAQIDMFDEQDDTIIHTLMDCGYRVGFHVLNAANLGVPQSRQRVIFIGIRRDLAKQFGIDPSWPKPLGYQYTVNDACPWIKSVKRKNDEGIYMEDASLRPAPTIMAMDARAGTNSFSCNLVESETDISRYATGGEWEKLEPGEGSSRYFSEVKAHPDRPSPTICASHGSPGIASVVHPWEKRKFSILELKRLCGFPDDFQLTGSFAQKWERLGRAVPPVMMGHIAAHIRDEILIPMLR